MHNSGNCWQISFAPQFEASPLWEEFLEEYFEVVCDNYGDDGSDNYVGYLRNPFDEADFRRRAAERKLEVPPYCVELLKSDNWLKDNVIRFAPLEVGEFWFTASMKNNSRKQTGCLCGFMPPPPLAPNTKPLNPASWL